MRPTLRDQPTDRSRVSRDRLRLQLRGGLHADGECGGHCAVERREWPHHYVEPAQFGCEVPYFL